jgi:hypothetical protein
VYISVAKMRIAIVIVVVKECVKVPNPPLLTAEAVTDLGRKMALQWTRHDKTFHGCVRIC